MVEKDKYAREGAHKGIRNRAMDAPGIDGRLLIHFPRSDSDALGAELYVSDSDLQILKNPVEISNHCGTATQENH